MKSIWQQARATAAQEQQVNPVVNANEAIEYGKRIRKLTEGKRVLDDFRPKETLDDKYRERVENDRLNALNLNRFKL